MSSIIDALKKSDAGRPRKNHGLNMRTDLTHEPPPKSRRGMVMIVAVLLLILVAVYFEKPDFVWQHLGASQQVTPVASEPTTGKTMDTTATPAAGQNKKLKKPAPTEVQNAAQQQAAQPDARSDQKPPANEQKATESQKVEAVVVNDTQDNQPAENNPADKQTKEDTQNSQTEPPLQQGIDQQLAATPMKNKQAIQPQSDDTQVREKTDDALPRLFELPYAVRKDIPKINLSVHVYDPVAENRMAIINGMPVHVGDTYEESITVQDITPSGVVLRIQNRDFIVLK